MTGSQRAQENYAARQPSCRSEIASELEKDAGDRDSGALERLTKEAQTVEIELRAALTLEQSKPLSG